MIRLFVTMMALGGVLALPAHSATLNKKVLLSGDVLTVGDVFEGAENNSDHVLGPAPIAGNLLVLDRKTLDRIATSFDVNWEDRTALATATVRRDSKANQDDTSDATMIKVPALRVPLNRSDIIKASDVHMIEVSSKLIRDNTALQVSDLVGQSALKLIKPDEIVSMTDVIAPKVIKRGEMVTISLNIGKIALTAKGRALEDARMGDIVKLKNESSDKVVQARVTGHREAVMEPQG